MKRDIETGNYFEHVNNVIFANQPALPNTIPSTSGFVGREDYLSDLREFYQNGRHRFVLNGIGGVGKTALALRFASEVVKDFEAKIFVEMQGMSKNPYSWRDAMFEIVRQFNPKISGEVPDAQLKSIFTQLIQNQKTLIVLDNAENKQSVEALIAANACFIITSRESFDLTEEKSIKIQKMGQEDARELLFEVGGGKERFDERADELADLAGYLPMALKPLASILKEDELETAADLIEKYRDKKKLLKERVPDYDNLTVEASFELSYEKLSAEIQERWRRLSVFPADFDEAAIASVLNISAEEANETQKLLRRFSLLEVNVETRRFNLHDLIREFIGTKLFETEKFQIQFLHAKYYASILQFEDYLKSSDHENGFNNALKLIDAEWSNITIGQKWTSDFTGTDNYIAELCYKYSIVESITLRLYQREYLEWQEAAFIAARKLNNKLYEINSLNNIGIAYFDLGEYREAIEHHEKSLAISRDIGNISDVGKSLGGLGLVYEKLGEYGKAIENYKQALAIFREIGDRSAEGKSLGNLGNAYQNVGDYQKAVEYHEKDLHISRETDDRLGESNCLGNLGVDYDRLGEHRKAIEYHEKSLAIKREIGDKRGEGICLGGLGIAYGRLGECQKAIEYHKQYLHISREIGDRLGEGLSLGNLGVDYFNIGKYRESIEYHEKSLAIKCEIGNRLGEGNSLGNLGNVYYSLGEKEKACSLWKQAVVILQTIKCISHDLI